MVNRNAMAAATDEDYARVCMYGKPEAQRHMHALLSCFPTRLQWRANGWCSATARTRLLLLQRRQSSHLAEHRAGVRFELRRPGRPEGMPDVLGEDERQRRALQCYLKGSLLVPLAAR
jgi:hypothetical protein